MNEPGHMSYMSADCTMPFCKGCGHTHVIRKLNDALLKLDLSPSKVCLVTDIGCIGLADALFETLHTVHTTHGRAAAFATGMELADAVTYDSKLKTIVLLGDGGAMVGLLHLVNAALLNVDVTVLLCNNFLFGMTGGQHSAFSPEGFVTPTTPQGNFIPSIDMCRVMIDSRAEFVARKLATDPDLTDVIADAIQHPGFALVEIVELCTEHGTTRNKLTGSALRTAIEKNDQEIGLLARKNTRQEFGAAYMEKFSGSRTSDLSTNIHDDCPPYVSSLSSQMGIIIAGSAGERVQSAARALCRAAMLSKLFCTQKNDNPVTQGSGFSLSEVIISPEEILYTGIENPAAVIVVSEDGMRELEERNLFGTLSSNSVLIIDASLNSPDTEAQVLQYPLRKEHGGGRAALKAVEKYAESSGILPIEAIRECFADRQPRQGILNPP